MANFRVSTLTVGLAVALTAAFVGCSDDAGDTLKGRGGGVGSSGGLSGGSSGGSGDGGPGSGGGPPPEEVLFRAVEAELEAKCGGQCHTDGTYKPAPPTFLAKPDAYKSIKAQPGVVVADFYQSTLLTKGAHAGPALNVDPTLETKVIDWLKMEAAVIQSQKKPSTDPYTVVNGPNEMDLTKAAVGGLTGVKLKFNASLVGGILSLDKLVIVAAAGPDVHVYKPRFIRVLPAADATGRTEIPDPADSFSNADQTVPNGKETALQPGTVLFAGSGWTPYNLATDKIRIEVEKLEPGKVQVVEPPATCVNVANFTANVLPSLRGGGGFTPNCSGCHGAGLAGLNLNSADQTLVCNQVLAKLNKANIAQSVMVTKVTAGPHNGGLINNAANWTALFTNNRAVFFNP